MHNKYIIGLILSFLLILILLFLFLYQKRHEPYDGSDSNLEKCKLSDYNLVLYENFLTKEECESIISKAKDNLQRSEVISSEKISSVRTSTQWWVKPEDDPLFKKISDKVAEITNYPAENQESLQILHYDPGQHYKTHYDACTDDTPECKADKQNVGYRVFTLLIYLNDVNGGGETSFPNLGESVTPRAGRAVLFRNLNDAQTTSHPCSLHWAHKPEKGEKWAINIWVRQHKT